MAQGKQQRIWLVHEHKHGWFERQLLDKSSLLIENNCKKGDVDRGLRIRSFLLRWSNDFQCCRYSRGNSFFARETTYFISDNVCGDDKIVHPTVFCNYCYYENYSSLKGKRYHCLSCDDFDACERCIKERNGNLLDSSHSNTSSICGNEGHHYCTFDRIVLEPSEFLVSSYSDSLINMLLNYGELWALGTMTKSSNDFDWISYRTLYEKAMAVGSGLADQGLTAGDFVVICAYNCVEYVILDLACGIFGFVTVPISPYLSLEEFCGLFEQVTTRTKAFVCMEGIFSKYISTLELCKHMKVIILFRDKAHPTSLPNTTTLSPSIFYCDELILKMQTDSTKQYFPEVSNSDLVTIAFTSGTTRGTPKGIPITTSQYMMNLHRYASHQQIAIRDVTLIYTQLTYTASRDELLALFTCGGQAGLFCTQEHQQSENHPSLFHALLHQFRVLRPTFMSCMPSFWCELYQQYQLEYAAVQATATQEQRATDNNEDPAVAPTNSNALLSQLHRKYGSLFGDRCMFLSTGSAYTPPEVLHFLKTVVTANMPRAVCFVSEGYGCMEVGGITTNGKFLRGVQWKLDTSQADRNGSGQPAATAGSTDSEIAEPSSGELLVKTPTMSANYYDNVLLSADRFTEDGYFRTGDLVELFCSCQGGGNRPYQPTKDDNCKCEALNGPTVVLRGRIGTMLKLSDGEFYSPELIETVLSAVCPSVSQIYIYGDITWSCLASVVVISPSSTLAEVVTTCGDRVFLNTSVFTSETCQSLLYQEIHTHVVQTNKLRPKQIPRIILFTTQPFTVESGELTSSLKMCRAHLAAHYKAFLFQEYNRQHTESLEQQLLKMISPMLSSATKGSHDKDGPPPVSQESDVWQYGLTSFAVIQVANQCHQQYQVPLQECIQMIQTSRTVKEMTYHLLQWQQDQTTASSTTTAVKNTGSEDKELPSINAWWQLAHEDLAWSLTSTSDSPSVLEEAPIDDKEEDGYVHILLTGVTGFIGSVMVSQLLFPSHCSDVTFAPLPSTATMKVYVIVRAVDKHNAQQRTLSQLKQIFPDVNVDLLEKQFDELLQNGTIECFAGDLSLPWFGLSPTVYALLQRKMDLVIHSAGQTSWTASYYQLRHANVLATQQVLQFCQRSVSSCCARGPIKLCYLSSLSALLSTTPERSSSCSTYKALIEDCIQQGQRISVNSNGVFPGYGLSKAIAEYLVRRIHNCHHLPVMIWRLGTISAHTTTGYSNSTDFTTRIIQSLLQSRMLPRCLESCSDQWRGDLDYLPVDYISKNILQACLAPSSQHHFEEGRVVMAYNHQRTNLLKLIAVCVDTITSNRAASSPQLPCSETEYVDLMTWIEAIQENLSNPLYPLADNLPQILSGNRGMDWEEMEEGDKNVFDHKICPLFDVEVMIPKILYWMSFRLSLLGGSPD